MHDNNTMPQHIAEDWLAALSASVENRDIDVHMALVSENVQVYGIPGIESLNYQQWKFRRHNEFCKNRLHGLRYKILCIKTDQTHRLGFEVEETMLATCGEAYIISKHILLEKEADDNWRVVEETIHCWQTLDLGLRQHG